MGHILLNCPNFAQEDAHNGISKLVRCSRTLVHREGMGRIPGETSNGVPGLQAIDVDQENDAQMYDQMEQDLIDL